MQASSYSEAVEKNLARYYTGKVCKRGHLSERYTKTRTCIECSNAESKARIEKDKSLQLQRQKSWREKNKEKSRLYAKEWLKNNHHKNLAKKRSRDAAKIKRTPAWIDNVMRFEMQCIYRYCSALRRVGLDYHVDHVVPLRGKTVSGLHVPNNLQVIHASENRSKWNKVQPCQDS